MGESIVHRDVADETASSAFRECFPDNVRRDGVVWVAGEVVRYDIQGEISAEGTGWHDGGGA